MSHAETSEAEPVRHTVEDGMFVRSHRGRAAGSIVFVHGLGESGLCFESTLAHPGLREWNRLAPDLPGYGRSAWLERPIGLEEHADRLAHWMGNAEIAAPITVVGHSMGGVIGILLVERHPDALDGLVDVDGNLSPGDCTFSGRAAAYDPSTFEADGFDRLRDVVYRQGMRETAHRGYYASLRLADPAQFHRNSLELVDLSAAEDLAARLAALPVETHYVAGVPRGASERSRELLDRAGVAWTAVEPSGHWPFIDRTDDFVHALRGRLTA